MPSAHARIATDQPGRYLTQLCRHAGAIDHRRLAHRHLGRGGPAPDRPEVRDVSCTETEGILVLSWGRCTLRAEPGTLTVHAEADDDANLARLQRLVAADLERFGHRDGLTVSWQPLP